MFKAIGRSLAYLSSFLLELFDRSFVNSTTFVDQMTSGGRLARVDVTNNNNVYVNLFLSHDAM
jgi:hypothetical protein